jgi:archaellin
VRFPHPYMAVLAALVLFAVMSGCGESEQAKAEKTVCEGKQEVNDGVNSLKSITLANASASTVQSDIKSIEAGLEKVKSAEGKLSGKRKEEVAKANAQLSSELSTIEHELSTLTLPQALTKLLTAAERLAVSYKQTFAAIEC